MDRFYEFCCVVLNFESWFGCVVFRFYFGLLCVFCVVFCGCWTNSVLLCVGVLCCFVARCVELCYVALWCVASCWIVSCCAGFCCVSVCFVMICSVLLCWCIFVVPIIKVLLLVTFCFVLV